MIRSSAPTLTRIVAEAANRTLRIDAIRLPERCDFCRRGDIRDRLVAPECEIEIANQIGVVAIRFARIGFELGENELDAIDSGQNRVRRAGALPVLRRASRPISASVACARRASRGKLRNPQVPLSVWTSRKMLAMMRASVGSRSNWTSSLATASICSANSTRKSLSNSSITPARRHARDASRSDRPYGTRVKGGLRGNSPCTNVPFAGSHSYSAQHGKAKTRIHPATQPVWREPVWLGFRRRLRAPSGCAAKPRSAPYRPALRRSRPFPPPARRDRV